MIETLDKINYNGQNTFTNTEININEIIEIETWNEINCNLQNVLNEINCNSQSNIRININ